MAPRPGGIGGGSDAEKDTSGRGDYQGRRSGSPADGSPRAGRRGFGSLSSGCGAEAARPSADAASDRAGLQAVGGARRDEAAGGGSSGGGVGFIGGPPPRLGSKSRSRSRSPGLECVPLLLLCSANLSCNTAWVCD